MNAPEFVPQPDLSNWLPAGLATAESDQTLIPRIAKDAKLRKVCTNAVLRECAA